MKKLLFIVAVTTFFIFGMNAQNSALKYESMGMYKKSKSERFDIIAKDGKPSCIFDKISQKNYSLTGDEITPDKSSVKTKCSVIAQKSEREDVATITLHVIGDPWGNSTGLQMFLDADAEIVDNFWDYFWEDESYFFNNSEYKIPENATYGFNNPQVILNGTGTVDIPGGVYDFLFLRPWPFLQMYFITNWAGSDEPAMADNFTFVAGFEYIFTVETPGDVFFETPEDIKLSNIILPISSLDLTGNEEISVVIFNNGMIDITGNIELAYKVNGGAEVVEIYSVPELEPGDEITYTFNAKADFSGVGLYTVEARVEYASDSNPYNNTITGKTKKLKLLELPFIDEFDTPASMDNWSNIDGNGDGYAWMYDNWFLTDADGGKGCLQVLCQTYGANEYLITDPIPISEAGTFHLSFYSYALGNDNIKIFYGTTFNVEEMELWGVVYPNKSDWEIVEMQLDIDDPGNYFFAFHYYGVKSEGASGVNLDKVNMTFASAKTYTITATAHGCATILPYGEIKVVEGKDQTFIIEVPLNGCNLSSVLVDDVFNEEAFETFTYTFTNVADNHTIEVFSELGVNELTPSDLHLYPNPVLGVLNVELEANTIDKVFVYNILGEIIHLNPDVNNSNYKLNTTDFASGIYFISVQTETGVIHSKFVVQ